MINKKYLPLYISICILLVIGISISVFTLIKMSSENNNDSKNSETIKVIENSENEENDVDIDENSSTENDEEFTPEEETTIDIYSFTEIKNIDTMNKFNNTVDCEFIDNNYIYGKGGFVLSDEDALTFLNRPVSQYAVFANKTEVKDALDTARDYMYSSNFEASKNFIIEYVDKHYFNDSCYARELLLLYIDSTYVGECLASQDDYHKNVLASFVSDPITALYLISSLENPYRGIINPKSYYLKNFSLTDDIERLDDLDERYVIANTYYTYNPIDIYKIKIIYDHKDYYAYVCRYSDKKLKILQFETTDGSLIVNENVADLEDISDYRYDSGIYDNRGD